MNPIRDIPRVLKRIHHPIGGWGDDFNGVAVITIQGRDYHAIFSNGEGWDHVSVSGKKTPSWSDMCFVRDLFWPPTVWVVQFHPPASEYVNFHPHCLHLWTPQVEGALATPPAWMVGPRKGESPAALLYEIERRQA